MEELNNKLKLYRLPIAFSLLGVVLILGGIFSSGLNSAKSSSYPNPSFPSQSLVSNAQPTQIKVDISGAVKNPAVYSLANDSRMEDALKLAGGFDNNADANYISKNINLSQKLTDGQKIYIPFNGEILGTVASSQSQTLSTSIVNINSASQSELEALPGIGPVTAQKIIASRPYSSLNDLTSKKVVSKSVFTKIQSQISVN